MHAKSARFFAKTSCKGPLAQLVIETLFPSNASWGRPLDICISHSITVSVDPIRLAY